MNCERLLTPGPNTAALPVSLSLFSIVPRGPGVSQPALKAKPFGMYKARLQFWNWSVILLLCVLSFVTSHAPSSLLKCHILTLLLCMNFRILLLFNNASKIFKVPSNIVWEVLSYGKISFVLQSHTADLFHIASSNQEG